MITTDPVAAAAGTAPRVASRDGQAGLLGVLVVAVVLVGAKAASSSWEAFNPWVRLAVLVPLMGAWCWRCTRDPKVVGRRAIGRYLQIIGLRVVDRDAKPDEPVPDVDATVWSLARWAIGLAGAGAALLATVRTDGVPAVVGLVVLAPAVWMLVRGTSAAGENDWFDRRTAAAAGILGVVVAGALAGSNVDLDNGRAWLAGGALAVGGVLVVAEIVRWRRWRAAGLEPRWRAVARQADRVVKRIPVPAPSRDAWDRDPAATAEPRRLVLWATLPVIVAAASAALALVHLDRVSELSGRELAELLVVTAVGEELLFRGMFLPTAYKLTNRVRGEVIVAVSFGLWHLPDAVHDASDLPVTLAVSAVVAQVVGTTLAGFAFSWLRHRTGSLAGPIGAHIATNLPGKVLVAP